MKKSNVRCLAMVAVAGGACSMAMAQADQKQVSSAIQRLEPISITYMGKTYPAHTIASDTNQPIYDNVASAAGVFSSGANPTKALDHVSFNPGPGAGAGRVINGVQVGWVTTTTAPSNAQRQIVVQVSLFNDMNEAATPINAGPAGAVQITYNAPAAGWAANNAFNGGLVDLSALPGGGIAVADDDIGVEVAYLIPTVLTANADFTNMFNGGGVTIGSSTDVYWRDANANGIYETSDGRTFGGGANLANFYMILQADVASLASGACCLPDGTCAEITPASCTAQGGVYAGDNSLCVNQTCTQPATGACCMQDGSCSVVNRFVCATGGGRYNGDGAACGACPAAYPYTGAPVAIEDGPAAGGCGTTAIAQIVVPDSFVLTSADVGVFVSHTWQGDVEMTLRHVTTGTNVRFVNHPSAGGGGYAADDYGTAAMLFRSVDTAVSLYDSPPLAAAIAAVTGSWKPANPLTAFIGENAQGTWNLEVADCANIDTGTINAVKLFLGRPVVSCYANCDSSTNAPCLNVLDFSCFLNKFAASDTYANCDQSTNAPVLNVLDFSCFLNKFAAGCSGC